MSFTSTIPPLALVALASVAASFISPPAAAADFLANKSIDLLIGAPAAGGYDIYARALPEDKYALVREQDLDWHEARLIADGFDPDAFLWRQEGLS